MDKHLHIVCFDVPYPADYGGVTDVYARIKALHDLGVKIHLHCFEYGRGVQPELDKYCTDVHYYKRATGWKGFSFSLPYIVTSRANKNLLQQLLKDDHPVLLEGIHCTYFIYTGELKNRKIFIRLHNTEFEYYRQLAEKESNFIRKIFFKNESRLLKKYEKNIAGKPTILAISPKDVETYGGYTDATDIKYLPAFSNHTSVTSKQGRGDFCLYHGNLSVIENEKAALWLIENVFSKVNIPLVIAGKNPSKKLRKRVQENKNISIISNPTAEKMDQLIWDAQIHVLPSFSNTGIKIKLLHAIFSGRHCLVNKTMAAGSALETLCHMAETAGEFITAVKKLYDTPFATNEIEKREEILNQEFNNRKNAELLMRWIY